MSNSFLALYYIMPRLTNHLVYVPKLGHSTRSHLIRGKGAGKLLLDGGRGGGHSYDSVSEFKKITNLRWEEVD